MHLALVAPVVPAWFPEPHQSWRQLVLALLGFPVVGMVPRSVGLAALGDDVLQPSFVPLEDPRVEPGGEKVASGQR